MVGRERRVIDINLVVADLKAGMTRYKKEDIGFGSIEEKYNLSKSDMRIICAHSKIKGKKVRVPSTVVVVDSEEGNDVTTELITEKLNQQS